MALQPLFTLKSPRSGSRWLPAAGLVFLAFVVLLSAGCGGQTIIKRSVDGMIIEDSLAGGSKAALVDGGLFTKDGWQPGAEGSLTYDFSGIPQGLISFDVKGLNRNAPDTIFLTLFEPADSAYADPFILLNPYRSTLTLKNFQAAPHSPFEFLWTIKNFPSGTPDDSRYIEGLPEGGTSYRQAKASAEMPIFPDQKYTIRLEWLRGKVTLSVNGQALAEHRYEPVLFTPKSLRLVLGRSPGIASFDLPDITFSNVKIAFPTLAETSRSR
ncbi:MAG TPA: hypothetical protein PK878_11085 [bacterium]|nr:hypothetical protein [bacterium]HOL95836.1 hypothetical protein [bacterium]HPP01687.1 hypothetical protein [bacterium]